MQRYLVLGRAKTGTTAISKTIQNTLGIENYHLEPQSVSVFENIGKQDGDAVVKILYDHWSKRPRLLNAVVHNELDTDFARNIFITRDPRAELVSRIHYIAFPYFQKPGRDASDIDKWLAIFRRKEERPAAISLKDIIDQMGDLFGVYSQNAVEVAARATIGYSKYLSILPDQFKTLLRYEDFVTGNLAGHPCENILSGSREVGEKLHRTRRTNGTDDWASFILDSDREWIDELVGDAVEALGYDRNSMPDRAPILPENCSQYVARVIDEARRKVA